ADAALLAAAGERLLVPRFRSSHHSAARFSEDRYPLFGIMLVLKRTPTASARRHTTRQRRWTFACLASTRMNSSGRPASTRGATARRAPVADTSERWQAPIGLPSSRQMKASRPKALRGLARRSTVMPYFRMYLDVYLFRKILTEGYCFTA